MSAVSPPDVVPDIEKQEADDGDEVFVSPGRSGVVGNDLDRDGGEAGQSHGEDEEDGEGVHPDLAQDLERVDLDREDYGNLSVPLLAVGNQLLVFRHWERVLLRRGFA